MTVGISDAPHPQGPANPNDPYLAADGTREPYWKKDVTPYQQLYVLNFMVYGSAYILLLAIVRRDNQLYWSFALSLLIFIPLIIIGLRVTAKRLKWRHKNLPWYSQVEPYSIDSFYSAKAQVAIGSIVLIILAIWAPMPVANSDLGVKGLILWSLSILGVFTLFKGIRRLAWRKAHPELVDNVIFQQPDDSSQTTTPS